MKNLPLGAELLRIARQTLLTELRPIVGESAKYTLAMIANAMAIAARELEEGNAAARTALARLDRLYGDAARELDGETLRKAVEQRERELARDIRCGRFDARDDKQRALLTHLKESVAARLRISNPKSLES
jgi:hypothetical protein